jgi:hypothetical protein
MATTLLLLIVGAVAVSVFGAGVAALVYFLTRQKNGSAKDPEDD